MAGSVIKPQPQDGLIQETGQQYFQGTQPFKGTNTAGQVLKTTFNTDVGGREIVEDSFKIIVD